MTKTIIYDNNSYIDRYTIIINDDAVYGMSENPLSPSGFNQYCGTLNEINESSYLGKLIKYDSLNDDVKKAIKERI